MKEKIKTICIGLIIIGLFGFSQPIKAGFFDWLKSLFIEEKVEEILPASIEPLKVPEETFEEAPKTECPKCSEPKEIIKEIIKEVPVEKIVYKDNPKQTKTIKELENEIALLTKQIQELKRQLEEEKKKVKIEEKIVYQPQSCPTFSCPTCPVCEDPYHPPQLEGNITMSELPFNQILFTATGEPFEFEYLIYRNLAQDGVNQVSMSFNTGWKTDWSPHQGGWCNVNSVNTPKRSPRKCAEYSVDDNVYFFWGKGYYPDFEEYRDSKYYFSINPDSNSKVKFSFLKSFELLAVKFKGLNSGKIIEF